MAMPDDATDLHRPSESSDDPLLAVASRILREELN